MVTSVFQFLSCFAVLFYCQVTRSVTIAGLGTWLVLIRNSIARFTTSAWQSSGAHQHEIASGFVWGMPASLTSSLYTGPEGILHLFPEPMAIHS